MFNYRDQADGLRRIMAKSSARIISVIGANGRPATAWMHQLSMSMLVPEHRLLLVHANRVPVVPHSLATIAAKSGTLKRGIHKHPQGYDLTCLTENDPLTLPLSQDISAQLDGIVNQLAYDYDTVMIEAQLNTQDHRLMLPLMATHELVIQLDRSDNAIKDAYATIKHISQQHGQIPLSVVVTGSTPDQGQQYFMRLNQVCKQFLGVSLDFLGAIPADEPVPTSVKHARTQPEAVKQQQTAMAFKSVAHRLEKQRTTAPSLAVA
ncbi:MinD/ParA family ATP-binding protein [Methylophilus medardicus]|uniref:MinD/ParA family protein n=1 Tax=Methylophilus medardicus TaxID=2588534 RepID=A0A5B8CS68_9PROT|nr:MinD/ParA family protein [Methylophilus medardicus]QDC44142.1 MinD/ParA family protein [Methylophilus medardicus]QDC49149.1 MinD/ParA family protein [Methylophilus medardicus]QDC52854.1 MinD/ParA family protein [Methylophilus medardicus]